jgi:CheY-like chemotaxis protein
MAHPLAGIRILVVEDDDDSREVLAHNLTAEGATVTALSTAAEALSLVPGADIIVTDYALPGDDAVWLLERVNKASRPIPVIAVSGYDERQGAAPGGSAFRRQVAQAISTSCVPRSPSF